MVGIMELYVLLGRFKKYSPSLSLVCRHLLLVTIHELFSYHPITEQNYLINE